MRKTLILSLFLAAALTSVNAKALSVPSGKAAILEAVIGKVQVSSGGKDSTASVGQVLGFGDRLSTGPNGRVSIRHAGNAISRLAPNSDLTLKAPGEKKGIFLSLSTGLVRFLVGKRAPGETFEVQTNNAVAAVKGTDASVGTDGKSTESAVYSSDHEKALELLDSLTGKSIMLSPGEVVGLGSEGFERRTLNKDDFRKADEGTKGLPAPNVDLENGGAADEETKAQAEANIEIAEAISDAFNDVMNDLHTDGFLERDDRTGDLVAGRIAFDRNGTRTQVSSYALHSSDNTILKATYSKRETGPFKGTSYAQEETTYNTALPDYWPDVVKRALDDPANLDGNGYPIWYKTSQYFLAGNPQGDLMEVLRDYQVPSFYPTSLGSGTTDPTTTLWGAGSLNSQQGYSQGLYLNGVGVFYFDYLGNQSYWDGLRANMDDGSCNYCDVITTPLTIAYAPQTYNEWNVNYNNLYGPSESTIGFNYQYYDSCCGGNKFLDVDVRVLDNAGNAQDVYAVAPNIYNDYLPRDFKGVDNSLNIELTFSSSYMSAPIDLLVIPEVFDMMDFFDMPSSYGSGGY